MQFQSDNLDHPIYVKSFDPVKPELIILSKVGKLDNPDNTISKQILTSSAIILFDRIISDWEPRQLSDLNTDHIKNIIAYKPEILIIGIGNTLSAIEYNILEPLYLTKTPFEIMTTTNACRTYNLLASEHRKVAVALII